MTLHLTAETLDGNRYSWSHSLDPAAIPTEIVAVVNLLLTQSLFLEHTGCCAVKRQFAVEVATS